MQKVIGFVVVLAALAATEAALARAACDPVSSLFHSTKRIVRSLCTSAPLSTRASSITSAVPDPSSLAASPQP